MQVVQPEQTHAFLVGRYLKRAGRRNGRQRVTSFTLSLSIFTDSSLLQLQKDPGTIRFNATSSQ
jgi:hypothetical protein